MCEKCGNEMHEWVRGWVFLEGTSYHQQYEKYHQFIEKSKGKATIYLELGVGMMTPMFIKEPFMNLTLENPLSTYITINPKHTIIPKQIESRSIPVKYDIGKVLADLKNLI